MVWSAPRDHHHPTGQLQRVAASPDRAIAAIQLALLWTKIFHRESPGAIVRLAPSCCIYANTAANRDPLSAKFSETERDRYLLALFRDGDFSGNGVQSEVVRLADGLTIALEKAQENLQ
ncbi:hypothetical protein [Oxynema aestuarii]|jgi:hypothetical protein|uniref:Uncharacterized protein n=1 Tax=Oxynema aestuarii AP17 TaxID=2064643 RepID=A0A6H1U2X5_9CYAN|nr:hypothetical protein [Oxynema aestuarii]QIZ73005.1 hypothetical protein HCG48_22355 [Oxynema aestuarii AP17]